MEYRYQLEWTEGEGCNSTHPEAIRPENLFDIEQVLEKELGIFRRLAQQNYQRAKTQLWETATRHIEQGDVDEEESTQVREAISLLSSPMPHTKDQVSQYRSFLASVLHSAGGGMAVFCALAFSPDSLAGIHPLKRLQLQDHVAEFSLMLSGQDHVAESSLMLGGLIYDNVARQHHMPSFDELPNTPQPTSGAGGPVTMTPGTVGNLVDPSAQVFSAVPDTTRPSPASPYAPQPALADHASSNVASSSATIDHGRYGVPSPQSARTAQAGAGSQQMPGISAETGSTGPASGPVGGGIDYHSSGGGSMEVGLGLLDTDGPLAYDGASLTSYGGDQEIPGRDQVHGSSIAKRARSVTDLEDEAIDEGNSKGKRRATETSVASLAGNNPHDSGAQSAGDSIADEPARPEDQVEMSSWLFTLDEFLGWIVPTAQPLWSETMIRMTREWESDLPFVIDMPLERIHGWNATFRLPQEKGLELIQYVQVLRQSLNEPQRKEMKVWAILPLI